MLRLEDLNALHSLSIDERALPLLENFVIGPNPQLKEIPSGIQHLGSLKELKIWACLKNSKKVLVLSKGSITRLLSLYQSFISIARFTQGIITMTFTFSVPSIWWGQEGKQLT